MGRTLEERAARAMLPPDPDSDLARLVAQVNAQIRRARTLLPWDDPVGCVQWIHVSMVQANDYNPNSVAMHEMKLLHTSISEDGYTQPVVAIWDPQAVPAVPCLGDGCIDGEHVPGCHARDPQGRYVIVDGFHRFSTMRMYADISAPRGGYLPVVVLDKDIADRMASTVRHNRARGKHSVGGMGNLVFQMLMAGESDESICNKIGLEPSELARLKHTTGYSKLYAHVEHSPLVLTKTQVEEKARYKAEHPDEDVPAF